MLHAYSNHLHLTPLLQSSFVGQKKLCDLQKASAMNLHSRVQ